MTTPSTTRLFACCALVCSLLGCNDQGQGGIEDLSDVPAFAVHRSDYESAAVALLDGDGKLLDERYISSGTAEAGLNAPLHGDIALSTSPCGDHLLTLTARLGGDYVLQVDLEHGEVVHQVRTQTADTSDDSAYRANPQDALCLDDGRLLVARFEPNLAVDEDDTDAGDDLVVIDPDSGEIEQRIDLSELRTTVTGSDDEGNEVEEVAYARPSSLVRVGSFAVVGLSRMSASFSAAEGAVALIDLEPMAMRSTLELGELKNCGSVAAVAGRDDAVLVQCAGEPWGDAESAGILLLSIGEDGELEREAALHDPAGPALFGSAVSLGGQRVVAVVPGDFVKESGDQAFVVDLSSGERTALFESDSPGAIGSGAFREDTGLLLIPDADRGVRLFDASGEQLPSALDTVELDDALPARTVRALRRTSP